MLLGEAVMLFHRKIRRSKKYRVLTDTDPLVSNILECFVLVHYHMNRATFNISYYYMM